MPCVRAVREVSGHVIGTAEALMAGVFLDSPCLLLRPLDRIVEILKW